MFSCWLQLATARLGFPNVCVCGGGDIKIWHDSAFLSFVWQLCSPKEEEGHFSSVSVGGMDGFIQGFNV